MIKTRIGLSLLSIVVVLSLMAGATYAYFTDTATSAGNTFSTGTFDINIKDTSTTQDVPFNVTDMVPGSTAFRYIVVTNDGDEDMKWKAYISGGNGDLFGALRIKSMILNPTDFPAPGDLVDYEIAGPSNTELISTPIPFSNLTDFNTSPLVWDQGFGGTVDAFEPGWAAVYKVTVEMDPDAGNSFVGTSWTGDMTFYATQEINPDWVE